MKVNLQLNLKPNLTITPKLKQAIRLLQLSTFELEQEMQLAVQMNPFLEKEEGLSESEISLTDDNPTLDNPTLDQNLSNDDWDEPFNFTKQSSIDWLDILTLQKMETTLQSYLYWQMELCSFTETEKAIATILIDGISDDGYLTCRLEDVQDDIRMKEVALAEIESVLNRIQQFEPLGVGARSLTECLTIQLNAFPLDTPFLKEAKLIATDYLELLGKRDHSRLSQILNLPRELLNKTIQLLTSLQPKPGNSIVFHQYPEYVIPDLIIRKKKGHFVVQLNREYTPRVKCHTDYENLIKKEPFQNRNRTLQEKWQEAKWLVKTLKNRNQILLTVATSIVESQIEFLEKGEEKMKPLNLSDIAKKVGLHESTISRITNQKYILTPKGVFELKSFFTNALKNSSKNNLQSSNSIRAFMKKCITAEAKEHPLSDQDITEILFKKGIRIARRTVTKYREIMSIPPSHERKGFI